MKSLLTDINQIGIGPASLSGQAGKILVVNSGETAYELQTIGQIIRDSIKVYTNFGFGSALVQMNPTWYDTSPDALLNPRVYWAYKNGLYLSYNVDYTLVGTAIVYAIAPEETDKLAVIFFSS